MIIYYTHSYNRQRGESHKLLERAIVEYLKAGLNDAFTIGEEAARLVSSISTTGEYGKPYIPGFAPFSISHSESTWAVLIAESDGCRADDRCRGVVTCGLDVQYMRKADGEAIARRFFSAEDAERIAGLAEGRDREFFRMWVRREALVKAAGTSVAGTDMPSAAGDSVVYGDIVYSIRDISIPGCDAYAAICFPECSDDNTGELMIKELC